MKTVLTVISAWVVSLTILALMIKFIPVFSSGWPETVLWIAVIVPLVAGSVAYIKKNGI